MTASDGTYTITGIKPGTYNVSEVSQAGWTCSYPDPCCYIDETFESGEEYEDNDFGNWQPANKSGMKFEDLDADGVKDAGETGLAGWTIYVDYNDNGVFDAADEPSAVTASDGTYTITGINPGTYKVREELQAGWNCSYPDPCYHEETFNSSGVYEGNDFGNYMPVVCYNETAWAYGGTEIATHNNEVPGNPSDAWGWTNYVEAEGTYVWDLYAGAGQNDITKGFKVGTVTVNVSGDCVTVTYDINTTLDEEYSITEAHLWVGETPLPLVPVGKEHTLTPTAAPGQFPYSPVIAADGLSATSTVCGEVDVGDGFYVAAHAVIEWCE